MTIRTTTRARLLACSALSVLALGIAAQNAEAQVVIDGGDTQNVPADTGGDWNVGSVTVGGSGVGTLNISDGAVVTSAGQQVLGNQSTGEGFVTIDGAGSAWNNTSGGFIVGLLGAGDVRLTNGGVLTNTGEIRLGGNAGAAGYVSVDGTGSLLSSTYQINVGYWDGSGTLVVSNGGVVDAPFIGLGLVGASDGILVIGSEDLLNPVAPGQVIAGQIVSSAGTGEVFLNHTGSTTIGANIQGSLDLTSHSGTTILSGANNNYSGVTNIHGGELIVEGVSDQGAGDYFVGRVTGDYGALVIRDGGTVANASGSIGNDAGSTGAATVTGTDSLWANSGDLFVGHSGAGTLTIADGGTVNVGSGVGVVDLGLNAGSAGILSVGAAAGDAAVAAGTLEASEVRFGAGTGALVFNHSDTDYVFAPLITGAGVLNHYAGTTILTADNTYTGMTSIHGGTLVIEGASDQSAAAYHVGQVAGDDGALILRAGGAIDSGNVTIGTNVDASGAVTVTGAGSAWNASSSNFRVGENGAGTLTISDGGAVSSFYGTVGLRAGSSGEATVTGAGSAWTVTSEFGVGSAGDGTVIIADGGSVTAAQGVIGGLTGATGDVTVTGSGSSWANSGTLYVAYEGQGALTVSSGANVSNNVGYIGTAAGSSASAVVTDAGSLWSSSVLYVGASGSGALSIAGGGVVRAGGGAGLVHVGQNATSTGTLNIGAAAGDAAVAAGVLEAAEVRFGAGTSALNFNHTDTDHVFAQLITGAGALNHYAGTTILTADNTWTGATTIHGGTLVVEGASNQWTNNYFVGRLAGDEGALIIRDGGSIANGISYIGLLAGSTGAATVTGAGSLWASSDDLYVGDAGNGTLAVEAGGTATVVDDVFIANTATGEGAVTVTGDGSTLDVGSFIYIGNFGVGALVIEDVGRTDSDGGSIGTHGGTGSVAISGAGSIWAVGGSLGVGVEGTGSLLLEDGGEATSQNGFIGYTADGVGDALIAGGVWRSETLAVGREGSGALTITADGLVSVDSGAGVLDIGLLTGSSGALNIGAASGDAAATAGLLGAYQVVFGAGAGSVVFNHTETDYEFVAELVGDGQVDVLSGTTTLSTDSLNFTGATTVAGGHLRVEGVLSGDVTVSGGSLGGTGALSGAVSVGAGSLVGEAGSVLTMGSLTLGSTSGLDVTLGAPDANALFDVTGDLTLDGTLDITDAGGFGAGVYGLITYGGVLTDNGLVMGDLPVGYTAGRFQVQTSVAGQVNLVNAGLADLLFWDGGEPTNADNGAIDGGDGTWSLTSESWTDVDGAANGAMIPVPGLAVFMGTGGTVTLDDSAGGLSVTGLQFAADGYVLTGDGLALVEETPGSGVAIRVGDGTAAGADWTVTIASNLSGATSFDKTDLGTLVLTGTNSWTGMTSVRDGALVFVGGSHVGTTYNVGQLLGDNGALVIRNGGLVTNSDSFIGLGAGSTGAATVTGSGSTWASSGLLSVGASGGGGLEVTDGGVVTAAGEISFGAATTGQGEGTVSGAGSQLSTPGALEVGAVGSGTLIVANGGAVSNTTGYIGASAGSTGAATVTGAGSLWANSGQLNVGQGGDGVLTIADGGAVSNGDGLIGAFAGSTGEVIVTGAGSIWTNGSQLRVGDGGSGVLTVANGGAVGNTTGYVGLVGGSTGDVTVTGTGSSWTNSNGLYVGFFGDGALTIANGGAVTNTSGFIGAAVGSTGAVTVTGAGSLWANSGEFFVAQNGSGALSISSGGEVTSGTGYIGYDVGSTGAATVTGANSLWAAASSLLVGRSGAGALVIADGGVVRAGGGTGLVEVGRDDSAAGVLSIGAAAGDAAVAAGTLEAAEVRFGGGTGTLVFNHTDTAYDFDAFITGAGQIDVLAGLTTLTGDSTAFTGATAIGGGDLRVAGTLGGDVTLSGGSLGGSGSVLGAVSIGAGSLVGVQGQSLTLGSLDLASTSTADVTLGAASSNALFDVTGDLTLDGTLTVTDAGGFGAGVYRLFDYGGVLTDNGLDIGSTPAGVTAADLLVQTSVAGQVNLVSAAGQDLLFWDGGNAALHDNGAVDGGAGTWTSGGQTWTGADGLVTSAMRPDPGFAVFTGTAGTVTVSGPDIGATGMQFAVDGYLIAGDAVALTEAETLIRVGDGTAAGAGMTATISAGLTGAGQLVKTDRGTLILTGANSYGGGVEVRDGTLIGDTDSLVGDIVNDAILVFDQTADATFAGAISGAGETFKDGAGILILTGANAMDWTVQTGGLTVGAAAFAGDVAVATGATFSFDPAADAVWAGVLSGSGDFAKLGGASLTLTGDSSGFDGTTTIENGSLVVNGALGGDLMIGVDGRIAGSGAIGQLTIADGATVSPGNSIGTLNVNGDLVIAAGSIYEVEVDPTGTASDLIAVTGTATINGGTVQHIGLVGDYAPSSSYTILTAAGGVTGTFDAVATDFAFLDATLGYTAQAVTLTLDRNNISFDGIGQTFNQQSTGASVEAGGWGTPLYGAVIGLSADDARMAFEQLSGELHGSLRSAMVDDSGQVRGLLGQRLRDTDQRGLSMWAQAHGAVGHMGADGNAASLRSRSGGLWLGAEASIAPGLTLGAAAGAVRSTHRSARSGEAERDGYRLAAYGSGQWGAFGLSGGVAGAWDDIETDRTVIFPGFAEQLEADYSAETIQAFAEATWTIPAGAAVIEPFASVARVRAETDGFAESGGDGALTVEEATQEVTFATLGLGARRSFDDGHGRTVALGGRIGWRHASGDLAGASRQAFAGGAAFTVEGLPVDEDALIAEIGGSLALGETLALKVDWTGQAGDHTAQSLSATLSWRF